jgi:hypothetical protein
MPQNAQFGTFYADCEPYLGKMGTFARKTEVCID